MLPRRAIIKVMHGTPETPSILHMLREACLLDALDHPGVIGIYDAGLFDGLPWFALEVVDGRPAQSAAIARPEVIAFLRDVAEVLAHAASRGVVHCGIRPENIHLTESRSYPLCVVGWDDARAHDAEPHSLVPCHAAWRYTAPELAADADLVLVGHAHNYERFAPIDHDGNTRSAGSGSSSSVRAAPTCGRR